MAASQTKSCPVLRSQKRIEFNVHADRAAPTPGSCWLPTNDLRVTPVASRERASLVSAEGDPPNRADSPFDIPDTACWTRTKVSPAVPEPQLVLGVAAKKSQIQLILQ